MQNELKTFDFHEHPVRIVGTPDRPLFVARDVGACLGIADVRSTIESFPEDERDTVPVTDSIGRQQQTLCLTEPGLYRLIFISRKEGAEAFRRWVLHDVIPTIRKTGSYSLRPPLPPVEEAERVTTLADRMRATLAALGGVDAKDEFALRDMISLASTRVRRALSGGDVPALPTAEEPRSVAEIIAARGLDGQVSASVIGKRAKALFLERHGTPPPTMTQRIGGRPTQVNVFPSADADLVHAAIDASLAAKGAMR